MPLIGYTVDTGDLLEWAKKMEEKGAEFGAEVMKEVKHAHEGERRERRIKFAKIRRRKGGVKRFAIQKDPSRKAELLGTGSSKRFNDIFKE